MNNLYIKKITIGEASKEFENDSDNELNAWRFFDCEMQKCLGYVVTAIHSSDQKVVGGYWNSLAPKIRQAFHLYLLAHGFYQTLAAL